MQHKGKWLSPCALTAASALTRLFRHTPQTRAYLTHLKPNQETGVMYPACPLPAENAAQAGRTCQKKLRHDGTAGTWRVHAARASCLRHCALTCRLLLGRFCEKHAASVEQPDWRYMISAAAADWSGPTLWLSAFGDVVRRNAAPACAHRPLLVVPGLPSR